MPTVQRAYPTGPRGEGQYHFAIPAPRRPGSPLLTCCCQGRVQRPNLGRPPDEVPPERRCQSKGCRQHWPDAQIPAQQREEPRHG